jgi:hypothetical protein
MVNFIDDEESNKVIKLINDWSQAIRYKPEEIGKIKNGVEYAKESYRLASQGSDFSISDGIK